MKSLLVIVAFLIGQVARVGAAEPPVTFTIEPVEPLVTGNVVYAPMGAENGNSPATARLWFSLRITNSSNSTLHVNKIQATFVTGMNPFARIFPRDFDIPANGAITTSLSDDEVITLTLPTAPSIILSVFCDGYTDPKNVQRLLSPYVPATPNGQYIFHADEGDMGPNEYFSDSHAHGVGSQMWGADWKVYRVAAQGTSSTDGNAVIRAGGTYSVNSDHLGWGIPIRAIADGVVLRTSTGWINNPTAGTRAFQKMGEIDGAAISDVKVTKLSNTRAASLQRLPSGNIQLSVWELSNQARQITLLGSSDIAQQEVVTEMAIDALTDTRVVGVVRLSNGNSRFIVWDIDDNAGEPATVTVSRQYETNSAGVLEVSIMKMATNWFATGLRTAAGELQLIVWEIDGTGIHLRASDSAGVATSIATTALTSTRVAISLRTDQGALKVIVWDLVGSGPYSLVRRGDATAENISRVVATINDGEKWVTAYRSSPGGLLKLARWSASASGLTLTAEQLTTGPAIQNTGLAMTRITGNSGTDHVATASIIGGNFQINGWGNPDDPLGPFETSAQSTSGAVTTVSIDQTDDLYVFAGARTSGGNLRINTWKWASGGGNNVVVKHGNCRVLYAHFQDGSVDTSILYPGAIVSAGQRLGFMGNSGASGAPHTHINSDRLEDGFTIEELIEFDAQYALTGNSGYLAIVGPRPIPYSNARAMRLSQIAPGGEGNAGNSFTTLNGQGMYDVSLGIRPRLNTRYVDRTSTYLAPTGRKEPLQTLPVIGGPFSQIIPALPVVPSGGRLYIRGGSYDETFTFSSPMIVRRYGYYDQEGPVVIGK